MKISRVEAIPYAIPYRKPLRFASGEVAHGRARARPGAHRRRRRRHRRRPAPAVHLRRDPGVGPLDRRRPLRPRSSRASASSSARSSTPAWTARSATRSPRRPSTWRSGTRSARPSACPSTSCSAASPTGCGSRTWSASRRPRRWSPRPSGCATTLRDHDVQGQGRTPALPRRRRGLPRPAGSARARRRALHRRQPGLDRQRVGSRAAGDGTTSTSRSPRSSAPPTTCSAAAGWSSSRPIPMFADESVARPRRGHPRAPRRRRDRHQHQDLTDRVHDQPAGARPVRGAGRRGRHRQPDRHPDGVPVRGRLRRRPPAHRPPRRPSSPTSST